MAERLGRGLQNLVQRFESARDLEKLLTKELFLVYETCKAVCMKILVTGSDGVLGSNLVRELLNRSYKVSVLLLEGSKASTLEGLDITRFYGNILNISDLNAAISGQDVVIHCAASTSVFPARDAFVNKVNIEGTKNVAEACLQHSIKRLVYVGTANSFGFGSTLEAPGKEGNPYASEKYGLDYMDSKKKAQDLVLEYVAKKNLPAVIVNPTFMIGPFDSKPSSGAMIIALYNQKLPGYTAGGKNYIAVKDAAFAIANAIDLGVIGECYILGNENLTYKEAFEKISAALGVKPPTRKLGSASVKLYGALNSFFARVFRFQPAVTKELAIISCDKHFFSSKKAQEVLKLPQTPIEVAVKECFEWFKENNYLKK